MRELNDFSAWADSVLNEALTEKTQNTPDRAIPIEKNIMYQAQRKYRDLEPEQALNLFLADKLDDFDRRDLDQNKVINRQRQENEKLRGQVTQISQELQDIEAHSAEADQELERIKQLGGKLQTDVETRKVSTQEVQEIMAQVEALKNKPGVDPAAWKNLKSEVERQVEEFKNKGVDPEKFKEFNEKLQSLTSSQEIEAGQLQNLERIVSQAEASRQRLGATAQQQSEKIDNLIQDLEAKERRFAKSIARSGVKYKEFEQRMGTMLDQMKQLEQQADSVAQAIDYQSQEIGRADKINDIQDAKINRIENLIASSDKTETPPESDIDAALRARLQRRGKIAKATVAPPNPEPQQDFQLNAENIELQESDPDEKETQRIAFEYANKFVDLYYDEFWDDADKRPIMQRYSKPDVMNALFQSLYNWLFRIGAYAVEETEYERIWRTALEILVAQHPYIDYEELGIDPDKVKGRTFSRPKPYGKPRNTVRPQEQLPLDFDKDVKESRIPKKYAQAIDDMASQILGDQYGKYLT